MKIHLELSRFPSQEEREEANRRIEIEVERWVKEKFNGLHAQNWSPRYVPNIAGILEDLRVAPRIKKRRFQEWPVGVDTGTLRNSISVNMESDRSSGSGELLVISAVDYAKDFHEGGEKEIEIDSEIRKNLRGCYWSNKRRFKSQNIGFLFGITRRDSYTVHVPARPLITEDELREIIERIYNEVLSASTHNS